MGQSHSAPAAGSAAPAQRQAAESAGGCLWMRGARVEPSAASASEGTSHRKYADKSLAVTVTPVGGPAHAHAASASASESTCPYLGRAVLPGSASWRPVQTGDSPDDGNAGMHSDNEWRAWMAASDTWIRPSWFEPDVILSEAEEKLINASLAALATGKPFQAAKEAQRRRDERERRHQPANKDDGEAAEQAKPEFDHITFLSFHFYEGLFMSVPSIRSQFRSEIAVQGKRMVDVMVSLLLRMAVAARTGPNTEEYASLRKQCREFVRRHRDYGVLINQYNIVGEALIHSLHTCIGEEGFGAATRTAWLRLYSFVVAQVSVFDEQLRGEDALRKEGSHQSRRSRLEAVGSGSGAGVSGSKSTSRSPTPMLTPVATAASPAVAAGCPMQRLVMPAPAQTAHAGATECPHSKKQTQPTPPVTHH